MNVWKKYHSINIYIFWSYDECSTKVLYHYSLYALGNRQMCNLKQNNMVFHEIRDECDDVDPLERSYALPIHASHGLNTLNEWKSMVAVSMAMILKILIIKSKETSYHILYPIIPFSFEFPSIILSMIHFDVLVSFDLTFYIFLKSYIFVMDKIIAHILNISSFPSHEKLFSFR